MKKSYAAGVFFFLFLINPFLYSQCTLKPPCGTPKLPEMFVSRYLTDKRINEFSHPTFSNPVISKAKAIKFLLSNENFVFEYTQMAMKSLFKEIIKTDAAGIRIYFALFNGCTDSPLPITGTQIIVLYTASYPSIAPDKYYFVNTNDDKLYEVSKACGETWRNSYETIVLPLLRQTINAADPDDMDAPGVFTDTKSIFFEKKPILDAFENEEEYQCCKHSIQISGYRMSFSAYTEKGNYENKNKKRLHLQYEYLYKKAGKKYRLLQETQSDYNQRHNPIHKLNNGQLCPVNCS